MGQQVFSFNVAKVVKESGIRLDLISTDIYDSNRENGPVYSLAKVMTKLLYLGYSLEEIIDSVTRIPSKLFKLKNMGEIKIGNCADFTIFEIVKKEVELVDSTNKKINYGLEIVPRSVVIDGEYIEI